MANSNIKVNMQFNADTHQAQSEINKLSSLLQHISTGTNIKVDDQSLRAASEAAQQLQYHLDNAINVDTGKLNLGQLNQSLNNSKQNIKDLANNLLKAGETGKEAFVSLTTSLAQAEPAAMRLNSRLDQMLVTLKNTARWQISSSLLKGLTGAVQNAYNYAENLNRSLNDIRIVTGNSKENMASFAIEANKSAKALSATTLEYTKASLIYYQQGLSRKEVEDRTNVTVKMANVTRQSTEEVSDQMTAIWNNFAKGSDNIEHFGDVLVKLGARTASSSDEIATGMEKFAAVADTVGLSYENAAAALATVTATTRQSADVVGTAFKTLFSRMEQLKQGETLDDGTTLGQYSQALANVGVQIKDATGELRSMDDIIEQTGVRWKTLSTDQQVALAQQVAGIRQYQQFMALMNNFDFYQQNVKAAKESNGALEEQNKIYAESWEAANKSVQASAESIYKNILNDEFFIKLTKTFSGLLDGLGAFIKGLGGVKGLIVAIAGIALNLISGKIGPAVNSLINNIHVGLTPVYSMLSRTKTDKQTGETKQNYFGRQVTKWNEKATNDAIQLTEVGSDLGLDPIQQQQLDNNNLLLRAKQQMAQINDKLTDQERAVLNSKLQGLQLMQDETVELQKQKKEQEDKIKDLKEELELEAAKSGKKGIEKSGGAALRKQVDEDLEAAKEARNAFSEEVKGKYASTEKDLQRSGASVLKNKISAFSGQQTKTENQIAELKNESKDPNTTKERKQEIKEQIEEYKEKIKGYKDVLKELTEAQAQLEELENKVIEAQQNSTTVNKILDNSKFAEGSAKGLANIYNSKVANGTFDSQATYNVSSTVAGQTEEIENFKNNITNMRIEDVNVQFEALTATLPKVVRNSKEVSEALDKVVSAGTSNDVKTMQKALESLIEKLKDVKISGEELKKGAEEFGGATLSKVVKEEKKLEQTENKLKKTQDQLNNAFKTFKPQHVVTGLEAITSAASGITATVTAINSLKTIFDTFGNEDLSFGEKLTTIFMSIGMLVPQAISALKSFGVVTSGIIGLMLTENSLNATSAALLDLKGKAIDDTSKAEIANILATKLGIKEKGASTAADALSAAVKDGKATPATIRQAIANLTLAETFPILLMAMIAVIAVIATVVGVVAALNAERENQIRQQEAIIENAEKERELIKNTKEQSKSVKELADEYTKLRNEQQDTAATEEKLKEQVPELIKQMDELINSMSKDDAQKSKLEQYRDELQLLANSGDWAQVSNKIAEIDKAMDTANKAKIMEANASEAKLAAFSASAGYGAVGTDGKYRYSDDTDITGRSKAEAQELNNALNAELDANSKIKLTQLGANNIQLKFDYDTDNPEEVLSVYNDLLKIKNKLVSEGAADTELYTRVNAELSEMEEHVDKLNAGLDELASIVIAENDQQFIINPQILNDLKDYEAEVDRIKKQLKDEYGFDDEHAESVFSSMNSTTASAMKLIPNWAKDYARANRLSLEQAKEELFDYWKNLPEEEKSLMGRIVFSTADSIEDIQTQMKILRDQLTVENAENEVIGFGGTAEAFHAYMDNLAASTTELKKNSAETALVTKNVYKLNLGLREAAKDWSKHAGSLKTASKNSLEYVEAMGNAKKALKGVFGIELSSDFIEKNLDKITALMNGETKYLKELQGSAAKDYINNLEIADQFMVDESGNIGDRLGVAAEQGKQALNSFIDELNAKAGSLSLGQNTTLDGSYLDTLQQMLDAQQITEDQLKTMFEASGYTFKVNGYRQVPGEKIVTTVDTTDGRHWEEYKQQYIQVPIINDQAPNSPNAPEISYNGGATAVDTNFSESQDKSYERHQREVDIINELTREYEKLGEAADNAFGNAKIKLIDQQIAKLKELQKADSDLVALREADYHAQGLLLQKKYSGLTFDENGLAINVNDFISDEQFREDYETYLSEYRDKYIEAVDEVNARINEEISKKLEKIDVKIELGLNINERDLKLLEHQIKHLENTAFSAAQKIAKIGEETAKTSEKIDLYQNGISETLKVIKEDITDEEIAAFLSGDTSVINGLYISDETMNKLLDYTDGLMDTQEELEEIRDTIYDALVTTIDEGNEEFEKLTNKVEHFGNVLSAYKDIIDLVGKDVLGLSNDFIIALNDTMLETSKAGAQVAKDQLEATREELKKAQALKDQFIAEGNEEAARKEQEIIDKLLEEEVEQQEAYIDRINNALEAAADKFKTVTNTIFEAYEKAVTGTFGSLDRMSEVFDRQQELSDLYLQDYKKMYETDKLIRNINKSIDATDNLKAQRQLNELAGEIAEYQKDGKQMSDYDLQYLQKKYDLLLAQQALEDARNAKDTVRLRRDANGNYGYVYTANGNKVADAEQKVADAQFALDDLHYQKQKDASSKIIKLQQDWVAAIQDLNEQNIADEAEYTRRLQEINDFYQQKLEANFRTLGSVVERAGITYDDTIIGKMLPDYKNFGEASLDITAKMNGAVGDLTTAWSNHQITVTEITAGLKDTMTKDLGDIKTATEDVGKEASTTKTKVVDAFKAAAQGVGTWEETYSKNITKWCNDTNTLYEAVNKLALKYDTLAKNTEKARLEQEKYKETQSGNTDIEDKPKDKQLVTMYNIRRDTVSADKDRSNIAQSIASAMIDYSTDTTYTKNGKKYYEVKLTNGELKYLEEGTFDQSLLKKKQESSKPIETPYTIAPASTASNLISFGQQIKTKPGVYVDLYKKNKDGSFSIQSKGAIHDYTSTVKDISPFNGTTYINIGNGNHSWIKKTDIIGYSTGGLVPYTGPAWVDGTPSRPEAFLNPDQTVLISNLVSAIEGNAAIAQRGLQLSSSGFLTSGSPEIQQNVTIHAEFPAATDRHEIEEAFNTLVNRTSQYINRS